MINSLLNRQQFMRQSTLDDKLDALLEMLTAALPPLFRLRRRNSAESKERWDGGVATSQLVAQAWSIQNINARLR